jgi:heptosyltransferase-1
MRILIVKTSSLGDLVHTLPAVTDAARAVPGLRCDWLAERAFAEIPAWHPAVERVIQCDLRSWRRNPGQTVFGGDWSRFRAELRQTGYDLVLDAQGLLKSALLARQARGPLAGPDRLSAREPLAAAFYQRGYAVPGHDALHAVQRSRRLFAQALGYPCPETPPDAGLDRGRFPRPQSPLPYAVFLHGTTWTSKRWPLAQWCELGAWIARRGLRVVLPWGSEAERSDAQRIAQACNGLVLPRLGLTELGGWLAWARLCVGVDTGLAHLAAALGTPQVSLYGPTLPRLTGAVGANQVWLTSGEFQTIDRERPNTVSVAAVQEALERKPFGLTQ